MYEDNVTTAPDSTQHAPVRIRFEDRFLQNALYYADLGMSVFACRGKHPARRKEDGGRGCKDATTDPEDIRKMWADFPRSNIGIATGSPSGIWALDIDGAEGEKSLADLEAKHGKLPDTVVSLTGQNGRHLLFRYNGQPIKNRAEDIGDGLDARATGGYIIAPPSIHPKTKRPYTWADGVLPDIAAIAEAPAWLIDLVCGENRRKRERQDQDDPAPQASTTSEAFTGEAYYKAALDGECRDVARTKEGGRNERLNIAALKLGRYVAGGHLDRSTVERELFKAAAACGHVKDDGETMARGTIKSGLDKGIAEGPRHAPAPAQKTRGQTKSDSSTNAKQGRPNNSPSEAPSSPPPKWYNSVDDVLQDFNEKYAVVNEAGKVVIYCPKYDGQLKRNIIERIQFEDFRRMYMNIRIEAGTSKKGDTIYSDLATVWLEHRHRRQFLGGVVMDPTGQTPEGCWNLWRGFTVEPQQGDWSLMHDHIRDVICNGDEELFAYMLGWLARMVQFPDRPGEVALVLRGKKGTGKGMLGNWLIRLLGQHSVHVSHAKHLVGNFNAHLRDTVFLFADEAFFAGDKAHEGALKSLVTEPIITIEAKYQNAVSIANMVHILMASNSDWVVPASTDERRFCVVDVSESRMQDIPYFDSISKQMENGGLAAMLHDLLTRDISDFNVRTVPQTDALVDQKRLSMDSLHRWWATVLERGFVLRSRYGATIFLEWHEFVATQLLHRSYLQWCADTRESRPMSCEQLGTMMKGLYKGCRPQGLFPIYEVEAIDQEGKPAAMKERPPGYSVGPLHEARAAFVEKTKIAFDWGDDMPDDTTTPPEGNTEEATDHWEF